MSSSPATALDQSTATTPATVPAGTQLASASQTAPTGGGVAPPGAPPPGKPTTYPYAPNHLLAAALFIGGLLVIFGTGLATTVFRARLAYTGGDAAASAGILFVLALLMEAPTLVMDDSPAAGGEPSTMRILALAIVLTFCILMLKTGWDKQALPSLENQGNWVWLVTAALGGKALQKFAEIKDQGKPS
jgi:hypothetical protein